MLIDDDFALRENVKEWLLAELHTVDAAEDGAEGLSYLKAYHYDIVVLDWSMPGLSGIEVLQQYRASGGTALVLMLTGRESTSDKITGLDAGADDYLTKPFEVKELSSRIRALLRRPGALQGAVLQYEDLKLDTTTCAVTRGQRQIKLSPTEYAILEVLLRYPESVFSSQALLDRIWSSSSEVSPESIRTFINRLRSKVDQTGETPLIQNIYGAGYKLSK